MDVPKSLVAGSIRRGTILHSYMFEYIGHGKFFVVIGVNEKYVVGFFFINSRINIHLEGKQELLNMQYPLRKSEISLDKLSDSIKDNITEIVGEMKREHVEEVLESARKSPLFSPKEIKQFLL